MVGTTVGTGPLAGREPEMALLASLIDGVSSKGASLVLRGEPGIGMSLNAPIYEQITPRLPAQDVQRQRHAAG